MTSKFLLRFGKLILCSNMCQHVQLLNVRLVRERIFGHGETPGTNIGTSGNDLGTTRGSLHGTNARRLSGTSGQKLEGAVVNSFEAARNNLGAPAGRLRGAPSGKTTKFGESRACTTRCRSLN